MLRRVETLLSVDTRRLMGGTFHSVGNRLLRRFGTRLGLGAELHDPGPRGRPRDARGVDLGPEHPDARAAVSEGRRAARPLLVHDQHGPPVPGRPGRAAPRTSPSSRRRSSRSSSGTGSASAQANACDYDDLLLQWKRLLDESPEAAAQLSALLRPRPRRRVPGHEPSPGGDRRRDGPRQAQRDGRRRRRPGDLLVPRRVVREHPRVSGALPGREDVPADAQLSLDAGDPGARQRLDRPQPAAVSQGARARPARRARCPPSSRSPTFPTRRASSASDSSSGTTRGRSSRISPSSTARTTRRSSCRSSSSRRGIPYEIRSGTRFFEQRHVKDVLAFLRIVVNPKDELSWKRALKLFPRVGERSAAAVWEAIGGRPDPLEAFRSARRRGRRLRARRRGGAPAVPGAAGAPRRPGDALVAVRGDPLGRRGRVPGLRAREVSERRRPTRRPRAVRPVRPDLRLAAGVPRGGHALQRALGRGRRRRESRTTTASCCRRSTRPRDSSGAASS